MWTPWIWPSIWKLILKLLQKKVLNPNKFCKVVILISNSILAQVNDLIEFITSIRSNPLPFAKTFTFMDITYVSCLNEDYGEFFFFSIFMPFYCDYLTILFLISNFTFFTSFITFPQIYRWVLIILWILRLWVNTQYSELTFIIGWYKFHHTWDLCNK